VYGKLHNAAGSPDSALQHVQLFSSAINGVAIAGSFGAIPVLKKIIAVLPGNFPAAVFVIQHIPPSKRCLSRLTAVLRPYSALPIKWAESGDFVRAGQIYVAPQDNHLVLGPDGRFVLFPTSEINFVRPSADPLFHSLAVQFGKRLIGVVLSGLGQDAAEGAGSIRDFGGQLIVQDRLTAAAFGMPAATLAATGADFVFPPEKIATALIDLLMAGTA
jgi:two-component system chemotaxis response regulator CheB